MMHVDSAPLIALCDFNIQRDGLCVVCGQVTTCNCAKCLAAKGGKVSTCGKCARAAAAAEGGKR